MANNDDDLMDILMKSVFQFFGWILKILFKITFGLVKGIIKGLVKVIKALFGKSDQSTAVEQENEDSQHIYSYQDAVNDYNSASETMQGEELEQRYKYLFINFLVNFNMSVDEKCKLIELNEQKINELYENPLNKSVFYVQTIEGCFTLLEQMLGNQSAIVAHYKNAFLKDVESGEYLNKPMSNYLGDIFSVVGAMTSKNGEFTLDYNIFDKYNIPKFVDIE